MSNFVQKKQTKHKVNKEKVSFISEIPIASLFNIRADLYV
jgi:hypothetical protein